MLKKIWNAIKYRLGWPLPPSPDQVGEKIVTMRESRDCLVAAIAVACGISYEQAHRAVCHIDLPWFFESPLLSNPLNAVRAIRRLKLSPDDSITWEQIEAGSLPPMKLIVLIHDYSSPLKAITNQHWVVWGGVDPAGQHLIYWGNSQEPKRVSKQELKAFYKAGWPNCAILVN
jgi:hypothetical protein